MTVAQLSHYRNASKSHQKQSKRVESVRLFYSDQMTISQTKHSVHREDASIVQESRRIAAELGVKVQKWSGKRTSMSAALFPSALSIRCAEIDVLSEILFSVNGWFVQEKPKEENIEKLSIFMEAWTTGLFQSQPLTEEDSEVMRSAALFGKRMLRNSTPEFYSRFSHSLETRIEHTFAPAPYKTVEEYLQTRLHFSGMLLMTSLLEYAFDSYLHSELLRSVPTLDKARISCAKIGVMSNDLFSFYKQRKSDYNLLNALLKTGKAFSLDEAVQQGINLVNEEHVHFLNAVIESLHEGDDLPSGDWQVLNAYIRGLREMVAATYHWQLGTNRYLHSRHFLQDLRP